MLRFTVRRPANPNARDPSFTATDDIIISMRNMRVGSQNRLTFVPSHSILQNMLGKCLHVSSVARAAHIFLDQPGLLQSWSPSHATGCEIAFCHTVAQLGYSEVARQLLDWLPRTASVSYAGRADDAAYIFEKLAGRFGKCFS
jgi:nuclear pore complex protein Nup160